MSQYPHDVEDETQPMQTAPRALTLEERRAKLRRAAIRYPHDERVLPALRATLTPQLIQAAAKHGVYLGYPRSDELFALEIRTQLLEHGIAAWMDTLDAADEADWESARQRCGVLLLILSPAALADADLQHDYDAFLSAGKVIIPLIHQRCDMRTIETLITPIDCTYRPEVGLNQLKRLLGG